MDHDATNDAHFRGQPGFATTAWSVVALAGDADRALASSALESLCRAYWYPAYAFVRRRGITASDACDLTQEFFASLIEKGTVSTADRDRGRFRTFLLTALDRFLIDEWQKRRRLKRGGGRRLVSIDGDDAEARYGLEPVDDETPERLYERRWALSLLERTLERLGRECETSGRAAQFAAVRPILAGAPDGIPYAEIAESLGTTVGALKTAIHRLRQRYGELLRAEIAETVGSPRLVDDELRALLGALA